MNIWQILESREVTQANALSLFAEGKCVGMVSTKDGVGRVFNPLHRKQFNHTTIQDAKDDLRGQLGGAVNWYDLSDYKFDFINPDLPQYELPHTSFDERDFNTQAVK